MQEMQVLRYKKIALWAIPAALIAAAALCVGLAANSRQKQQAAQIGFPAYQDGKTEYNAAVYEVSPFTLNIDLPHGWETKLPPVAERSAAAVFTPVCLYEGETYKGFVGYNIFEDAELPQENYYQAVYSQLRLGSLYRWDGYTPIATTDTTETALATVSISQETEGQSAAAWPVSEVPGILSYDKGMLVYVAVQLEKDAVTQEQLQKMADSIRLTPSEGAAQKLNADSPPAAVPAEQGGLTFSFPNADADPQAFGKAAFDAWIGTYIGDSAPPVERIADYKIDDITIVSGTPKEGRTRQEMKYHYVVRINYSISTASEEYLSPGDGVSGKGTFEGLFRELCVRDLGNGSFDILSAGTGGGEQEFLSSAESGS